MKRSYSLQITLNPNGSAQHVLRLHYYGLTPHGDLTKEWGYTGWLRVYLPPSATLISSKGAKLTLTEDLGRRVVQGWFYVQFDHTLDVTMVYSVNVAITSSGDGHFALLWQKQAGRIDDPISVTVNLPSGWSVSGAKVGTSRLADGPVTTNLSVDRGFVFDYRRD
jgi:hypothetical protein